jgi:membrane protein
VVHRSSDAMAFKKRQLRTIPGLLVAAAKEFGQDEAMTLGAGLAFYTALSLAPLLVLLLWIGGSLGEGTQQQMIDQVIGLMGKDAGESIRSLVESADDHPTVGSIAGIFSVLALIMSASGVFAQLQHSMNLIWGVEPKPGRGIRKFLRARFLSISFMLVMGFILLVSLVLSAGLSAAINVLSDALPGADFLWSIVDFAVAFAVFVLLFASMFKILPDAKIAWREVWIGAIGTAFFFVIGKILIGLYLGNSTIGSAYGAAGSFLVLLVWVYYSSLIVFFGAELTQVLARHRRREIVPRDYAQWIDPTTKRAKHAPHKQRKGPAAGGATAAQGG